MIMDFPEWNLFESLIFFFIFFFYVMLPRTGSPVTGDN